MPGEDITASPNAYGIETEYSCMITLPGEVVYEIVGSCHSLDADLDLYAQPSEKGSDGIGIEEFTEALRADGLYRTEEGFLSNGGRLYIDPSGPEYATPETSTAEEAVHRTFDGDEIIFSAFNRLRSQGTIEGFQLNRRVVDHNRTSRGIHLNTTTTLKADEEPDTDVQEHLALLNVVKGAIFGSGGLLVDEEGRTSFHHSPRLSVTSALSDHFNNYTQRPLVRWPFKPDEGGLARIETVTSDALNFAWPLRASLVATNALIGLIELNYDSLLPRQGDLLHAALVVGEFGNGCQITTTDSGGEHMVSRPLDVMREICEVALDVNQDEGFLDMESNQVMEEIVDVIDRMKADPYSVIGQVESMARLVAIQKKMESAGVGIDSETICRFDYAWDWIGGGIAEGIRKKGLAGWQGFKAGYSPADTKKRLNVPPQDTRAAVRGEVIRRREGSASVGWNGGHLIGYMPPLLAPEVV